MSGVVNREIGASLAGRRRAAARLATDQQREYVDTSRNIAVCLDSRELRLVLENCAKQVGSE